MDDDFELEDFHFWTILTQRDPGGFHMFQKVMSSNACICIPPNNTVPINSIATIPNTSDESDTFRYSGNTMNSDKMVLPISPVLEYFMVHILTPSKLFVGQFNCMFFPEKEVRWCEAQSTLETCGSSWTRQVKAAVLRQERISSSCGEITIYVLDRSFLSLKKSLKNNTNEISRRRVSKMLRNPSSNLSRGTEHSASNAPSSKTSNPDCAFAINHQYPSIETSVTLLGIVDVSGSRLTELDREIQRFKATYVMLSGFESCVVERLNNIINSAIDDFDQCTTNLQEIQRTMDISLNDRKYRTFLTSSVHNYVLTSTYKKVYNFLTNVSSSTCRVEVQLSECYECMKNWSLERFGVKKSLCEFFYYSSSTLMDWTKQFQNLHFLVGFTNCLEKMHHIRTVCYRAVQMLPEAEQELLTADELVPLVSYSIVHCAVRNLYADVLYCSMLIPFHETSSQAAYYVTTLETAIMHLIEMNRNSKCQNLSIGTDETVC